MTVHGIKEGGKMAEEKEEWLNLLLAWNPKTFFMWEWDTQSSNSDSREVVTGSLLQLLYMKKPILYWRLLLKPLTSVTYIMALALLKKKGGGEYSTIFTLPYNLDSGYHVVIGGYFGPRVERGGFFSKIYVDN